MRVRLSLLPPFKPQKLLVPVPSSCRTISELKKYLHASLSQLSAVAASARDLKLEIDGYELLAGSEVSEILREGDDVGVSIASPQEEAGGKKRRRKGIEQVERGKKKSKVSKAAEPLDAVKDAVAVESQIAHAAPRRTRSHSHSHAQSRSHEGLGAGPSRSRIEPSLPDNGTLPKRRRVTEPPQRRSTPSASSSSSSSDNDDEVSTSSASSSSPSLSSSSSSSSSSYATSSSSPSSSSSAPDERNSKKPVHPPSLADQFPSILSQRTGLYTPPGQGKPETQNRNQRRKIARQYKKMAATGTSADTREPADVGSGAGSAEATDAQSFPAPSELPIPKDMSNRNKKKGFRKDMQGVVASRTIFRSPPSTTNGIGEVGNGSEQLEADIQRLRGSEEKATAGSGAQGSSTPILRNGHSRSKGKWTDKVIPPSEQDLPSNVFVTHVEFFKAPRWHTPKHDEDEDDEEEEEAFGDKEDTWVRAERDYPTFSPLLQAAAMAGMIVAWKELHLDPYTFTPELRLQLATIQVVDAEGWSAVKIPRLAEELDLGDPEQGHVDVIQEEEHEVKVKWASMASGQWKVLPQHGIA